MNYTSFLPNFFSDGWFSPKSSGEISPFTAWYFSPDGKQKHAFQRVFLCPHFWSQNITIGDDINDELEIDEITNLYNKWIVSKGYKEEELTDEYLLDILSWMMPEIVIENNKYIYNISCKLWVSDKEMLFEEK